MMDDDDDDDNDDDDVFSGLDDDLGSNGSRFGQLTRYVVRFVSGVSEEVFPLSSG
jgi:hypothetical protein